MNLTEEDIGKRFRTRDGRETVLMGHDESEGSAPFYHQLPCDPTTQHYVSAAGMCWSCGVKEDPYDLISRIEETELCLEVGKTYEDDSGDLVEIVAAHHDYFIGVYDRAFEAVQTFTPDGGFRSGSNDLIKEHTPPPVVEPVWVYVYPSGNRAIHHDLDHLLDDYTAEELSAGQVHCVPMTWEPGRRDDLEEGNG